MEVSETRRQALKMYEQYAAQGLFKSEESIDGGEWAEAFFTIAELTMTLPPSDHLRVAIALDTFCKSYKKYLEQVEETLARMEKDGYTEEDSWHGSGLLVQERPTK
jgi:hypothetical protein